MPSRDGLLHLEGLRQAADVMDDGKPGRRVDGGEVGHAARVAT